MIKNLIKSEIFPFKIINIYKKNVYIYGLIRRYVVCIYSNFENLKLSVIKFSKYASE